MAAFTSHPFNLRSNLGYAHLIVANFRPLLFLQCLSTGCNTWRGAVLDQRLPANAIEKELKKTFPLLFNEKYV